MIRKLSNLLLITAVAAVMVLIMYSNTMAASGNVSYNCEVTQVNQGDEVKLIVTTKAMSICSFIASVQYDGELLEYKGYQGGVEGSEDSAYLVDANSGKKHEVAVEQAEDGRALVGMYMVGAKEVSYKAGEPLVTLYFRAKSNGSISETSFVKEESTDGTDGYTSEGFVSAAKEAAQSEEEASTTVQEQRKSSSWGIIIAVTLALVVLVVIITVIRRRRKTGE